MLGVVGGAADAVEAVERAEAFDALLSGAAGDAATVLRALAVRVVVTVDKEGWRAAAAAGLVDALAAAGGGRLELARLLVGVR